MKNIEKFCDFITEIKKENFLYFFSKLEEKVLAKVNEDFNDFITTKSPKQELLYGLIYYNSLILEKIPTEYYKQMILSGKSVFTKEINKKRLICSQKDAILHNMEISLERYGNCASPVNTEGVIESLICYILFEETK